MITLLLTAGFSKQASADPIILLPSATTPASGYSFATSESIEHTPVNLSDLVVGSEYAQIEVDYAARPGVSRFALSGQSAVLPETFTTPAVSVGIRDIGNSAGAFRQDTLYGRGYYLVLTKNLDDNLKPPKIKGVSLSAGIGVGSIRGIFAGASADLPLDLVGTAEFDSRRMNYKVALPVAKFAGVSFERLGSSNFVGLEAHTPLPI